MRNLFCIGLCFVSAPALAQTAEEDFLGYGYDAEEAADTSIVVVASGLSQHIDETGQAVSVVGPDEIDSIQGPDLARVFERLPGVTFSRNGGLGNFTGLRIRGANAEQVLVMIDGIRVADVAAPGGGYDFGNLAVGGIGKVELLRGSNSVIWGSEAIGGVVAVTSRQVDGIEASAEYGARDTFDGQVNAGLSGDTYGITLNGGYTRTDGVSAAAVGTEADAFRQWRAGGRGHIELAEGLTASLVGRYTKSRVELDGFPPPSFTFADIEEFQKTREASGRAGLEYSSETFNLDVGFAHYDIRRRNYIPSDAEPIFGSKGRQQRAEIKGSWQPVGALRVIFGADHEWSRYSTGPATRRTAKLASGHALLGWYGERVNLSAGIRIDDHSRFGSEWTFGANGSVEIADDWRIRASYGEGFKVPTLFQLYSDFGNTALMPERSRSYDIGIEKGDRNGRLHFALTAFRRDTRSLIDFVSCFSVSDLLCDDGRFGFYANVGKARAEGVELEMGAQLSERLRAQAVYTYVKAVNRTEGDPNRGNDLARRPRHAVTVALDWRTPLHDLTLGGDIRMVSKSFDDVANAVQIDSHVLVTLRASLPVSERIELFGRVENLTDADYVTVAGYGTSGRSAYIGARARF